jgi:hypothetical protein
MKRSVTMCVPGKSSCSTSASLALFRHKRTWYAVYNWQGETDRGEQPTVIRVKNNAGVGAENAITTIPWMGSPVYNDLES